MTASKFKGTGAKLEITDLNGDEVLFNGELIDIKVNADGKEVDFTTMESGEYGDFEPGDQGELTLDITSSCEWGAPPPIKKKCIFTITVKDKTDADGVKVAGSKRAIRGFIKNYSDSLANEEMATTSFNVRATAMIVTKYTDAVPGP